MKFERFDRQITLQRLEKQVNSISSEVELVVAEEVRVWAEFRPLTGSEHFAVGREISTGYTSFIIRFRPGIDGQSYRIRDWLDRIWDIRGEPRIIGRRSGLEIFADLKVT